MLFLTQFCNINTPINPRTLLGKYNMNFLLLQLQVWLLFIQQVPFQLSIN